MSKRPLYGYPHVTDPNDFDPDPECSSPDEREAHRLACANYGKPAFVPNKEHISEYSADGTLMLHIARTSWGLGCSNIMYCDGCDDMTDDVVHCHDCEQDFCSDCWPKHDAKEDCFS